MKDRQVEQSPAQSRIPVVSAVLHCVSMTVIVFLRSSFGFGFLRPRSIFFAFAWAIILFSIYAWNEPTVWRQFWALCLFGLAAATLYFIHFFTAFFREIYREGAHDNDSGKPHSLRILGFLGRQASPKLQKNWHIWGEPLLVLVAGLLLRIFGEHYLSAWLILCAPCLCLKEALNHWFQIRQKKRHRDSRDDAEDIFEDAEPPKTTEAPKPVGKDKVKRPRASSLPAEEEIRERQFAQVLRLMPPYRLTEAEQNYRELIKRHHPDPSHETPESNAMSAELNDAITFFRKKLG